MTRSSARRGGFTLLEVAVAIAILAVALTAIFSSEAGAIKVAHRARNTGVATLLARCKMAEIEQTVHEEGLPAVSADGSDECCEGAEVQGYTCDWKVERIVLPDLTEVPGEDDDNATAAAEAAAAGDETSVNDLLEGAGPTGDAMAQIAVGFTFPVLKPSIEDQVRRATVTVKWQEGTAKSAVHSFDVVQYLVSGTPPAQEGEDQGASP